MTLRTVSWVMLTVLGSFVLLASFLSMSIAYRGDYAIGGTAVEAVASGRQEVLLALRGIRGTSAAFAAAYAVLFLSIVPDLQAQRDLGLVVAPGRPGPALRPGRAPGTAPGGAPGGGAGPPAMRHRGRGPAARRFASALNPRRG
jgi:hypothetical protein